MNGGDIYLKHLLKNMDKYEIYEPYGYIEGEGYVSKKTQLDNELEQNRENDKAEFASVEYDQNLQSFVFKNVKGDKIGYANVKDIIPQDLISDVVYDSERKILTITFTNGKTVEIPLNDLIDVAEAGDGLTVVDNKFCVLLNNETESFLTVNQDGLLLKGVQEAIDGEKERATSAETTLDEKISAETNRAVASEGELDSKISQEVTTRENEDNRVLDDVLTRIWTNKAHNSGSTGYFKTVFNNQNGSYAQLWNEADGGGSQYFNNTANILSYVGTNDGDENGICVQIYSKNKTSNLGSRLNVNPNGMYYTKNKTNGSFTQDDELVTKADIQTLLNEIESLKNRITTLENN